MEALHASAASAMRRGSMLIIIDLREPYMPEPRDAELSLERSSIHARHVAIRPYKATKRWRLNANTHGAVAKLKWCQKRRRTVTLSY